MDIGSMRQRIILQKHILHTDEIGNHQSHWENLFMFAYVNLASGKENVTDILNIRPEIYEGCEL